MRTILFVCTGNTCRSPMAEAITRRLIDQGLLGDRGDLFVASAGTAAASGIPPTREGVHALEALGIRLEGNSKPLAAEMVRKADFVFCMTARHLDAARTLVPDAGAKIMRLDPDRDIEDPIGLDQDAYDALARRLMEVIPTRVGEQLRPGPGQAKAAMKIALGTDHRGYEAGLALAAHLEQQGHEVAVLGECHGEPCDYPDVAYLVAQAVRNGEAERGLLMCGTGIGVSIAANKVPGIRAALVHDDTAAKLSREHNDATVLCLPGESIPHEQVFGIVDTWLGTQFESGGRHERRVNKIAAIERGEDPAGAVTDAATKR